MFEDQSKAAQAAVYGDLNFRNQFREELKRPASFGNWERITVHEVHSAGAEAPGRHEPSPRSPRSGQWTASTRCSTSRSPTTCENEFTMQSFNTRVERMTEILRNKDMLLGLGDGGAHLDMLCDSGYPTYVLGTWVRERKALSLEEAVRRMTSDPADFFGIHDRGRLQPGLAADLAIFDPATVGSAGRPERRYDLPGGAKRMVMRSQGIEYTVVNGAVTWERGALTGAAVGQVLRS